MGKVLKVFFMVTIFVLLTACSRISAMIPEPLEKKTDKFVSPEVMASNAKPAYSNAENEHLYVLHKNGQTFIVWDEKQDFTEEWYGIYRYSEPITKENLDRAKLLYRVPEDSAYFYANRYKEDLSNQWKYRYLEKMTVGDDIPLVSNETGFFVWTIGADDVNKNSSKNFFYGVTIILQNKEEVLEAGYSAGPINERINDPLPVEIPINVGSGGHLFVQYMNLSNWNETFHAPNQFNQYYGLDGSDSGVKNSIQYAYDYIIYEPNCNNPIEKAPIAIHLHALNDGNYPPRKGGNLSCTYQIYLTDWPETWYFGFAESFDYRKDELPIKNDIIVNYTEQRILRMVYDLIRNPIGPEVDINRIYVYGHSMGGSGALALSLHYPNLFAAAHASEPMTNYVEAGEAHGLDWRPQISILWGTPEENLPVKLASPSNWADHLQNYNDMGVWDWQNHRNNLYFFQSNAVVPIGIAHGMEDIVIEWKTQGKPIYRVFNETHWAWGGVVTNDTHTSLGFQGIPPGIALSNQEQPFSNYNVIKNEMVPGFSNANNNSDIPPKYPGQYNQTLTWSSSWNNWNGIPIDTPNYLEISVCSISSNPSENLCGTGSSQTVDITPHRVQNFIMEPGKEYFWENRTIKNNLMYFGLVKADSYGLITVNDFVVFPEGNRLVIKPTRNFLHTVFLPYIGDSLIDASEN